MSKGKKLFAGLIMITLVFSLIQMPILSRAEVVNGPVSIKIRYDREDGKLEGWSLIASENDSEMKDISYVGNDSEGNFAVVETNTSKETLSFNFINDEEKLFKEDQTVDLSKGSREIVVNTSKTTTVEERDIKTSFDEVTVNLNYFRFDDNYTDWDVWGWCGSTPGKGNPFKESEFGMLSTMKYKNVASSDNVCAIVRKSDWSQKDGDSDRVLNKTYANNEGVINVYIAQGDAKEYYIEKEVDKSPKLIFAKIDDFNKISFKANYLLSDVQINEDTTKLYSKDEEIIIKETEAAGDSFKASILTEGDLDLNEPYTLAIEGFGEIEVSLGSVYDTEGYAELYTYSGELGALYSKDKTSFVVWTPMATSVKLALYGTDGTEHTNKPTELIDMEKGDNGIWSTVVDKDINGQYYNYIVTIGEKENVVTDPYAKAVGVNGKRGMVIDLEKTNPAGWELDKKPELVDPTDSIIYEMHIRDFSIDKSSGTKLEYKGKYNGVWQPSTTIPGSDIKTGVDHLKELGVNTVHILPTFDHQSIDETKLDTPQFNWGYDPQNYNVPEGSYSSDPYKAEIRINEFKEMVQALHKEGIRVVMDVVYNHTGATVDSNLNLVAPNYYYRQNEDNGFSNSSGCGNETASERSMVRKLIVDSVVYWAKEYHIDGFRFDLMGIHDITTMKDIREELDKIDSTILVYGEGWTAGDTPLAEEEQALKKNMPEFGDMQVAAFSDDIRDGIKGHVFNALGTGFVNGGAEFEETIKFGVVASTENDQIDYEKVANGTKAWANQPYQTVSYVSAHDNLSLWDKLQTANSRDSELKLLQMNKMAAAIVYTSQGIPFMQAGEEFARTKVNEDGTLNENSYNSPDSVNLLDWNRKVKYSNLYNYYKGLISLRNSHKAFRLNTTADIQDSINFLEPADKNVVAYTLDGSKVDDSWNTMAVLFNANTKSTNVELPSNNWVLVVDGDTAGTKKIKDIKGKNVTIPANTSFVLVDKDSYYKENPTETPDEDEDVEIPTPTETPDDKDPSNPDDSGDIGEGINPPDEGADKEDPTKTPGEGDDKDPTNPPTRDSSKAIILLCAISLGLLGISKSKRKSKI